MSYRLDPHTATGHAGLDHQRSVALHWANAFAQAQGQDAREAALARLTHFMELHFAYEEGLLHQLQVVDRAQHQRSHQLLLERLYRLGQHLDGNERLDQMELEAFLDHWALVHMPVLDAHLGDYLATDDTRNAALA